MAEFTLQDGKMIKVTRFDGNEIVINAELVEMVESTPDTVISLTTKNKILVRESVDEIIQKVLAYKQTIHAFPDKDESAN